MEEARNNPSMVTGESQEQKGGYLEAQRDKTKVHFATLMDMCHLKNAEFEPKFQKFNGRVVLRGDIVKDDSGAYAVFYRTGLVCVPKDCRESCGCHCKITRLSRTSSSQVRQVSVVFSFASLSDDVRLPQDGTK